MIREQVWEHLVESFSPQRRMMKRKITTGLVRSIGARCVESPTATQARPAHTLRQMRGRAPLLKDQAGDPKVACTTAWALQPRKRPDQMGRGYTVQLAQTTLDLGKQVPHEQMEPLSRLLNSITVEQMLAHKRDKTVYEVYEDEPVINAIRIMCEKKIGSVIVRGSETQLDVGMMSRIDCMRNLVLKNQFARETPIKNVMENTVRTVRRAQARNVRLRARLFRFSASHQHFLLVSV